MTTEARFERQLPAILEDLYLGPTPDYRDEVLAAATARDSGRPGPSQEGGSPWLTSQVTPRSCHACRRGRSRWGWSSSRCSRSGDRRHRFARTTRAAAIRRRRERASGRQLRRRHPGDRSGDRGGQRRSSAVSRDRRHHRSLSPDGQRIEFMRLHDAGGVEAYDVVVANADGSNPMVVSDTPLAGEKGNLGWTPDSRFAVQRRVPPRGSIAIDADRIDVKRVLPFETGIDFQPPDGAADPVLPRGHARRRPVR